MSATNASNTSESQTFQYDLIGRITYNSKVGAYSYPAVGSPRPHGPVQAGSYSMTYDANGNLLSGGGAPLTWGLDNRLKRSGSTEFTYDGLGDRVKKATPGGSVSLYPMGDDFEITDGVVTKYVSAAGLGVVAKRVGSETFWLHTDRLGSIQAVTDASGSEVLRRTYRPYGDTLTSSTSHTESRGWIDQRQDPETGLTYLHARYYASQLGVFLSPDPLHPRTRGVGLNRFGYGLGDPFSLSDRSGLVPTFPSEVIYCYPLPRPGCDYVPYLPYDLPYHPPSPGPTDAPHPCQILETCDTTPQEPTHPSTPDTPTTPPTPETPTDPSCLAGTCPQQQQGDPKEPKKPEQVGSPPVPPGLPTNEPIHPSYSIDWKRVGRGMAAESGGIALDLLAARLPCGGGRQTAHALAAAAHLTSSYQMTVLALGIGAASASAAGPSGGVSLLGLAPAGASAWVAGNSLANAIDSAAAARYGCR